MPRTRRTPKNHPLEDPAFQRQVERLMVESRSALPDAEALDAAAVITPEDIDAASALWDRAQGRAGTGLGGLLDAKQEQR